MEYLQRICILGLLLPTFAFATTKTTTPYNAKPSKQIEKTVSKKQAAPPVQKQVPPKKQASPIAEKQTIQKAPVAAQTKNPPELLSEPMSSIPLLYAAGYTGSDLVTQGDLLIPLHLTNNNTFVIYGQSRYSPGNKKSWESETWTGSGGLLYRQIIKDTTVLGAYVLTDYSHAYSGHKYWMVSPGLESLGRTWDFHLNGYLPMGESSWKNQAWAQEFGDYSLVEFQEGTNNIYDHLFAYYEETGPGGDAEIGRKLFKIGNLLVKGYVQGYYYNMKHNDDITGGGVKITAQPARYITFSANNTYDNYNHNTFMLGAQIKLNDLFNKSNKPIDENNLTNRLLDPIERSFGTIGAGTSAPTTNKLNDLGRNLFSSNGVFFDDNGSGYISPNAALYPKGTYGNPYTEEGDLFNDPNGMQGIFNNIRNQFTGQVLMLFAPGTYYTSTAPGNVPTLGGVQLPNGLSMYGRDYWYLTPTIGNDRALFSGSLQLLGNNYLESIIVQRTLPAPLFVHGILIDNANNIEFNNVQIGSPDTNGYVVRSIRINNSSAVTFNNSQIYICEHPATGNTNIQDAIYIANSNNITLENNNIVLSTAIAGNGSLTSNAFARGIVLFNSTANIGSNNSVTSFAQGGGMTGAGSISANADVYNLWAQNGAHLYVTGNNNIFNATGKGGTAISADSSASAKSGVYNLFVDGGVLGSSIDITGNNNAFNILESTGGYAKTDGIVGMPLIQVNASAFSADISSQGNNNTINITGSNNYFSTMAQGGQALSSTVTNGILAASGDASIFYGPLGLNNHFNISGRNNNFFVVAAGGSANTLLVSASSTSRAAGIGAYWNDPASSINVGDYTNMTISATGGQAVTDSAASAANADSTAYGVGSNSTIVMGNYNTLTITSTGGSASQATLVGNPTVTSNALAYGLYTNTSGDITLRGNNHISLIANAGFTASLGSRVENATAYGLFRNTLGNIYFWGGYNRFDISAIATLFPTSIGKADAYGINNPPSNTHFAVGAGMGFNAINLTATSNTTRTSYGIYTNTGAFYQAGVLIPTVGGLNSFLNAGNYMSFTRTTGGSGGDAGNKLQMGGTFCDWFGTPC